MRWMKYGDDGALSERAGSGIGFLVILFIVGFFFMNLLRQQNNLRPQRAPTTDRSSRLQEQLPRIKTPSRSDSPSNTESRSNDLDLHGNMPDRSHDQRPESPAVDKDKADVEESDQR